MSKAIYGYCPKCGAEGISVERRIDGNSTCKNGHTFPRKDFIKSKSMLQGLEESINLQKLNGACHISVKNAFFANYVTALLLLKLQDIKGLMIINDHNHSMLSKFSNDMSDLNFWGRSIFYSNEDDVKFRMNFDSAKILSKAAAKVSITRIQKIMKVPLTAPDYVDWDEAIGSILLLQHTFELKSTYFNAILRTLYKWDSINIAAKQKSINDALMFMMQSDPSSKLIQHLRKLSNLIMSQKIGSIAQKVVGFRKLHEDEGGGDVGGATGADTSTANIGSTNAILNPAGDSSDYQNSLGGLYRLSKLSPMQVTKKGKFTIRAGKLIKKKVKDFAPKRFKAPDFLKPKKEENKNAV